MEYLLTDLAQPQQTQEEKSSQIEVSEDVRAIGDGLDKSQEGTSLADEKCRGDLLVVDGDGQTWQSALRKAFESRKLETPLEAFAEDTTSAVCAQDGAIDADTSERLTSPSSDDDEVYENEGRPPGGEDDQEGIDLDVARELVLQLASSRSQAGTGQAEWTDQDAVVSSNLGHVAAASSRYDIVIADQTREYARYLGMEAEDSHLMWIADAAVQAPLPRGWRSHSTQDGLVYFYHKESGETSWEHPSDPFFKNL